MSPLVDVVGDVVAPVLQELGGRPGVIDLKTLPNGLRPVIVPLEQFPPAVRTALFRGDSVRLPVEDFPVGSAHQPVSQAADGFLVVHFEIQNPVFHDPHVPEDRRQRPCLVLRSRKPVEHEPARRQGRTEYFPDDSDHDVIRDQLARIHDCLGPFPEISPRSRRRPKHVSCRYMRDGQFFGE